MTSKKRKDGTKSAQYGWDSEGHLLSVTLLSGVSAGTGAMATTQSLAYKYDALNRRIEKDLTDLVVPANSYSRRYVYDGSNIVAEADATGRLIAYYVQGPGLDHPIAMLRDLDGNGTLTQEETFYYTRDALGSTRVLTNGLAQVVQRYRYTAYGQTTVEDVDSTGDHEYVENPFAFTGREWDREAELYGYRARYYSPEMGRFLSRDPLGFGSGDTNSYRYAFDNSLRYVDPSGHLSLLEIGAGLTVAAIVVYLANKYATQHAQDAANPTTNPGDSNKAFDNLNEFYNPTPNHTQNQAAPPSNELDFLNQKNSCAA